MSDKRGETLQSQLLDETCAAVVVRLVDGASPGDDPALGAHLRSCLTCFRAAADLREVPRIEALLGAGESGAPAFDPGESFWAGFPQRVIAAYEAVQVPAAQLPTKGVSRRASGAALERFAPFAALSGLLAVLRRPWAAAVAGAAVAGFAVYLAGSSKGPRTDVTALAPAASGALVPAPTSAAGDFEVGATLELGLDGDLDEDLLQALNLADLQALLRDMTPAEPAEGELEELGAATMAEEIEQLDEAGLIALRARLGRSI